MSKRNDLSSIISRFENTHNFKYNYSKIIYKSCNDKVIINCSEHGDFLQTPKAHWNGAGCPKCYFKKRRLSENEFILKAKEIHKDKFDYSKTNYVNARTRVIITCKKHGDFNILPNDHLVRDCLKCYHNKMGVIRSKIKTTEDFINHCSSTHNYKYSYDHVNYVNKNDYVKIICKDHGEFYQKALNHIRGHGCKKCVKRQDYKKRIIKNKLNVDDILSNFKFIHNNKYLYPNISFTKKSDKINIICDVHGEFKQSVAKHLDGGGCYKCKMVTVCEKNKFKKDKFLELANKRFNCKYNYDDMNYNGLNNKIKIICHTHGEFYQTPRYHLRGVGCLECNKEFSEDKINYLSNKFIEQAKIIHGDKYDYNLVRHTKVLDKVDITCKVHGVFKQVARNHLKGSGCGSCSKNKSKNEINWINELKFNNRNILTNQILIINGKKIKPDGYDPKTKTIYEYNGNYWHGNPEIYNPEDLNLATGKTFGELYNKTIKRENFLIENGYFVVSKWGD